MERYIISGKGSVDNAIVEVTDGRISHAPDVLEQWQGKDWGWVQKKCEQYGWTVGPLVEINICDPLGVGNWPY